MTTQTNIDHEFEWRQRARVLGTPHLQALLGVLDTAEPNVMVTSKAFIFVLAHAIAIELMEYAAGDIPDTEVIAPANKSLAMANYKLVAISQVSQSEPQLVAE